MLWLEGNQSARWALTSSFAKCFWNGFSTSILTRDISNSFQQTIYYGLLYWPHVGSLLSTTVLTAEKVSWVFGVFLLVHNSNFCSAVYPLWPWMFGRSFQKMCPQHPFPTVEWSCDTDLIIKIGRKFNNLIEAFQQSESRKMFSGFKTNLSGFCLRKMFFLPRVSMMIDLKSLDTQNMIHKYNSPTKKNIRMYSSRRKSPTWPQLYIPKLYCMCMTS